MPSVFGVSFGTVLSRNSSMGGHRIGVGNSKESPSTSLRMPTQYHLGRSCGIPWSFVLRMRCSNLYAWLDVPVSPVFEPKLLSPRTGDRMAFKLRIIAFRYFPFPSEVMPLTFSRANTFGLFFSINSKILKNMVPRFLESWNPCLFPAGLKG